MRGLGNGISACVTKASTSKPSSGAKLVVVALSHLGLLDIHRIQSDTCRLHSRVSVIEEHSCRRWGLWRPNNQRALCGAAGRQADHQHPQHATAYFTALPKPGSSVTE